MPRHSAPRQFSSTDVLVIRAAAHAKMPVKRLAQHYGVSRQTIEKIVNRETYRRDVDGQDLPALMLPVLDFRTPIQGAACIAPGRGEYTKAAKLIASLVFGWSSKPIKPGICAELGHHPSKGIPRTPEVKAKIRYAHLKRRFGDRFDEEIGKAAAGLAPRMPLAVYQAKRSAIDPEYKEFLDGWPKMTVEEVAELQAKLRRAWGVQSD